MIGSDANMDAAHDFPVHENVILTNGSWLSFKIIKKCKLFDTFEWYKYIGLHYEPLILSRFLL
jgi:hypothetical protein